MNVLHVDEQRGWRGGEQQASWLIQGLVERGHSVTISGRRGGAFLADDHGGANPHRVPLPFRSELDVWTAWKLARVVRERNIDILHAHTSHAHMGAVIGARQTGEQELLAGGVAEYAAKLDGRIGHVHLIDCDGTLHNDETSTHSPFGTGDVDFQGALTALQPTWAGLEWCCFDFCFCPTTEADARKAIPFVTDLLSSISDGASPDQPT